jgi:hypothetical protein
LIEFTPVRAPGATGTGTASVTFDDATNMPQIVAASEVIDRG